MPGSHWSLKLPFQRGGVRSGRQNIKNYLKMLHCDDNNDGYVPILRKLAEI